MSRARLPICAALFLGLCAAAPASKTVPLPPPRPDVPAAPMPAPGTDPEEERRAPSVPSPDGSACEERLTRMGVKFEPRAALSDGTCGATGVVTVSGLPDGVEVSPPSPMACPVAEALARWTLDVVSVEADRHLREAPTKMLVGTSYECRKQRSGGKMSEHAYANAVDLMGFAFAKRGSYAFGFPDAGSPEAQFQSAIQKGACPHFTTVLGPGSDAAHGNHLHLDLRARKGGYRICQ